MSYNQPNFSGQDSGSPHPYGPENGGYGSGDAYSSGPTSANPYVQQQVNPYEPQPGAYSPQPYGAMNPYGFQLLPEHPSATAVLVLGILSLVFGGITGPFAWVTGNKARREIRENPGRYRDGGMLTVGWVLGIVGTVYLILMVAFVIIYVVFVVWFLASTGEF